MKNYPVETIPVNLNGNDYVIIQMIKDYYQLGSKNKARELAERMYSDLLTSARFYAGFYEYAKNDFDTVGSYLYCMADVLDDNGDKELADIIVESLSDLVNYAK